jgi:hypothetical protein
MLRNLHTLYLSGFVGMWWPSRYGEGSQKPGWEWFQASWMPWVLGWPKEGKLAQVASKAAGTHWLETGSDKRKYYKTTGKDIHPIWPKFTAHVIVSNKSVVMKSAKL